MNYQEYNESGLDFIKITADDSFEVTLCSLGASLYRIKYHNNDMIMSCENVLDYFLDTVYYGKTIGRVCGRYKNHELIIDNKVYPLQDNENGNTLHSGFDGLHTKIFNYDINDEEEDVISVEFDYFSPDGEAGFPGKAVISVEYRIYKDNIEILYTVFTNEKTPISLTNHSYFNLGEKDLSNLKLQINSDRYADVDNKMIPISLVNHTKVTDFSLLRNVNKYIDDPSLDKFNGYDMYYACKNDEGLNLTLQSDKYKMEIISNFKGCQIYSDNFKSVKSITSKDDKRRSIAIEPEDNPLLDHIQEDNEFVRFIKYTFSTQEKKND